MSKWTPERRAAQSAAIREWKPWEKSTGPRTERGKVISSQNAMRTGEHSARYKPVLDRLKAYLRGR